MQTLELDSKQSMYPMYAAAKARMQNAVNSTHYTQSERNYAILAKDLLDEAYGYDEIYVNYRKTCISIKLDHPVVRNRKMAKDLESIFEERGIVKVKTPQGVLYRIKHEK